MGFIKVIKVAGLPAFFIELRRWLLVYVEGCVNLKKSIFKKVMFYFEKRYISSISSFVQRNLQFNWFEKRPKRFILVKFAKVAFWNI